MVWRRSTLVSESPAYTLVQRALRRLGRRPEVVAGLAVLVCALVLYGTTLDDGLRPGELLGGDLITHQYAQVQARPSNAPGYPLYTMGGWLWFRLGRLLRGQAANPIPILSSYSTLWAIAALALLYSLCLEVTKDRSTDRGEPGRARASREPAHRDRPDGRSAGNWPIAVLCTAFYAVTYFFWYYAVTTEQYTSAVAQTLAMIWLAFRWDRVQGSEGSVGRLGLRSGDHFLLLLALLAGMGLAHMITVLLVVPLLLWFILSRRPEVLHRPRLMVGCLALAALPLVSYIFVYVQGAQHPDWRGVGEWSTTWSWFRQFLSTRQGRAELTWSLRPLWTHEFPSLIWGELTWGALALGLVGIGLLGRRRAGLLYATLVLYLAFSWVDRLGNWYQVIMPAYPLLVMGMAVAMSRLWQVSGFGAPLRRPKALIALRSGVVLILILLVGYRFALSLPRADSSQLVGDTGLDPGWSILEDVPLPRAAVLGDQGESVSLRYLTEVWGQRPDVIAVGSGEAGHLLLEGDRPVYATVRAAPLVWSEISPQVRLSSAGLTLIELRALPQSDIPLMEHSLSRDLGDNLRLLGYDLHAPMPSITLYWQAISTVAHDWSVSVRPTRGGEFLSSEGSLIQFDNRHPVHGLYPTSGWAAGEVVRDDVPLVLPPGVQADGISIICYRTVAGGFENLGTVEIPWPG